MNTKIILRLEWKSCIYTEHEEQTKRKCELTLYSVHVNHIAGYFCWSKLLFRKKATELIFVNIMCTWNEARVISIKWLLIITDLIFAQFMCKN